MTRLPTQAEISRAVTVAGVVVVGLFIVLGVAAFMAWLTEADAQLPPPEQYEGPVRVNVLFESPRNVRGLCAMISGGRLRDVDACAGPGYIIATHPCWARYRREVFGGLMCHEIRHVNGFDGE